MTKARKLALKIAKAENKTKFNIKAHALSFQVKKLCPSFENYIFLVFNPFNAPLPFIEVFKDADELENMISHQLWEEMEEI